MRETIQRIQYEANRPKAARENSATSKSKSSGAQAQKFNPWQVVKPLSEGGQGHTFVVRKNGEGPLFVLKRLKNAKRLERFRAEIKAGLSLDHPNIVKVVDSKLDSDPYYLVMDYCEQDELAKWEPLSNLPLLNRL